jgi:hypothetical protein
MPDQLLDLSGSDCVFINVTSKEVVLMIHNLGSVSVLGMGGITAKLVP